MSAGRVPDYENAFDVLRRFARRPRNVEQCELCSLELAADHPHLVEVASRRLVCACDACALLFSGREDAKFKRVPRDIRLLNNFQLTDAEWEALLIPINMAFFFRNSLEEKVMVFYPSPAGATESLLELEAWSEIVAKNPVLQEMKADVEALLVNRVAHAHGMEPAEYYLLPIDQCYKLVGLIRRYWHGLSGGTEVWKEITHFFRELKQKATVLGEKPNA